MKKWTGFLGVILLLCGVSSLRVVAEESVTLNGVGLCAKCALGQTDSCQNAIKVSVDGKEVIYLLTANAVSKAFHKNICTGSADISAVGVFQEAGGKKVFTASKLSLRKEEVVKGEGLCLKCALDLTPACQNGVRALEEGQQVLYILTDNDVSKAFHEQICQKTAAVVVSGKISAVAEVAGVKKLTPSKIDLAKAKAPAAAKPKAAKPEKAKKSEEKTVQKTTIKGLGMCAKCELGETPQCQNAVKLVKDGKEWIYLFADNDLSKDFHKNICTSTANIIAVGDLLLREKGRPIFTAIKLEVQESKKLEGVGLCLKCELSKSRVCQNAIRVSTDGKDVLYILDQNSVSKKFHRHLCQGTASVVAEGTVAEIDGRLEFTTSKIELK